MRQVLVIQLLSSLQEFLKIFQYKLGYNSAIEKNNLLHYKTKILRKHYLLIFMGWSN